MRLQSGASRLNRFLFAPVDIAFLVYFRILFGCLAAWLSVDILLGLIRIGGASVWFNQPAMLFKYYGFGWVQPPPGDGLHWVLGLCAITGVCIALGLAYRVSAALFFVAWTYHFLLDQANYLNHFYLISLFAFLLIFMPANRAIALDTLLTSKAPVETAPVWCLWLLRFQMALVYFNAGLAKVNFDWLTGKPIRTMLQSRADEPLLAFIADQELAVYALAYGGLILDLFIVPALLWKPARTPAVIAAGAFHASNVFLFDIDVFPALALGATLLFYPPDWPRRVLTNFGLARPQKRKLSPTPSIDTARLTLSRSQWALAAGIAIYAAIQLAVPFRHVLYPGNHRWTEEGRRFSWHVMASAKKGRVLFIATDPKSGQQWKFDPARYLNPRQVRTMATHPDMILQFSHYVADALGADGYDNVDVRALTAVSFNGREPVPLVDPNADLSKERRSLWPASWILQWDEALRHRVSGLEE